MQTNTRTITTLLAAFALQACGSSMTTQGEGSTTTPTVSVVEEAPNNSFVSVSGTVTEADEDGFMLDYGGGDILVEMDDFDWFAEGTLLVDNDQVIVYGKVDDDFFERRSIEARSVYLKNLGTQFMASSVDEEDYAVVTPNTYFATPRIDVVGTVKSIDGREFVLDTGAKTIEVDTIELPYNPLDLEGYQRIRPGDRVRVSGELKPELFDEKELEASVITTLQD